MIEPQPTQRTSSRREMPPFFAWARTAAAAASAVGSGGAAGRGAATAPGAAAATACSPGKNSPRCGLSVIETPSGQWSIDPLHMRVPRPVQLHALATEERPEDRQDHVADDEAGEQR